MEATAVKSVCVFCGSNVGRDPAYLSAAVSAGKTIARAGLTLVYGGGKVGLMGAVAEAALAAGGRVVGVMPRALFERELAHPGLSEFRVVESMHERKQAMESLADGFIALPGGAGTFEEFFEQWTWAQLGIHAKPCGLLNVKDFFQPLLALIDKIVAEGFLTQTYLDMLIVEPTVAPLLGRFESYVSPPRKWHAVKP
jgi:uncharacterized protein (TIGR00730 family)